MVDFRKHLGEVGMKKNQCCILEHYIEGTKDQTALL